MKLATLWSKIKIHGSHFLMYLFLCCGMLTIADIYLPIADAAELNFATRAQVIKARNLLLPSIYPHTANSGKEFYESSEIYIPDSVNLLHNAELAGDKIQETDTNATRPSLLSIQGNCNPGFIINNDTSVCRGSILELHSREALTYAWSSAGNLNNTQVQNPYSIINYAATYYLTTTSFSQNLIANPDFELGNTGFYTDYTYCNGDNCLWPMGDYGYTVGADASYFLRTYFSGHDHTSGAGNFLIINGGRPSLKVWSQTIAVNPGTEYTFVAWICRLSEYDTSQIRFSVNGSMLGNIYKVPAATNRWERVTRTWRSGSQTQARIEITDTRPVELGNDFGIDDIYFGEVFSCTDSVRVAASVDVNLGADTVITPPDQLLILAPGDQTYSQYTWSTGEHSASITVNQPGVFWLSATDQGGCTSVDTLLIRNSLNFVVFPNSFTPDADGSNDFFRPVTSNIKSFHMSVFNRWGQLLFETDNANTGWNGFIGQKPCPADVYSFIATYEFLDIAGTKSTRGIFQLLHD